MALCTDLKVTFESKQRIVTDNGNFIDLKDLAEFSGNANASFEVDQREKIRFGFIQRLNFFRCKKVYSFGGQAYRTISTELNQPAVDKFDKDSIFFDNKRCKFLGRIDSAAKINGEVCATLKDYPSISSPIPLIDTATPLIWIDYYADFTTWLGYESQTHKPGDPETAKDLYLLKQWKTTLHYSYLRSRVSSHVNMVDSVVTALDPVTSELKIMLNGNPANEIVGLLKPKISITDEWKDYIPPPPP